MYQAQYGKDKRLNELYFKNRKKGFFVDIGSHDGKSINCTHFLEKELEWTGICVEPLERRYQELVKNRENSICVNKAVYNRDGYVLFRDIKGYPEMLSGIEETYNPRHQQRINHELGEGDMRTIEVPCITLNTLLEENNVTRVDYLKIDTEGSELEILKALDFEKFDIECIDVENNYGIDFKSFLNGKGYSLLMVTDIDEVYVR